MTTFRIMQSSLATCRRGLQADKEDDAATRRGTDLIVLREAGLATHL